MEVINYCLNDFEICEEHYNDFFKAKNKKDSQLYYIKKYNNKILSMEKIESLKNKMFELSKISNLKFYGLFEEDKGEEKAIYLLFEFFNGKLVCNNNYFQNYEIWAIAEKLLEIFEKLSKEGIRFNRDKLIDVFEISINELKINIFDIINNDVNNENEDNEILFNIGVILEKIIKENFFKGFINDLKNNKIDILTAKTQFKQFLKYSLYFDNINNDNEIINYKEMLYLGSLKDGKPNGIGILSNECGLIYQGEFREGEINGKGKMFIYNKNNNISQNKKINTYQSKNNIKNLIKIFEGIFTNGVKNGKFNVYNEKNSKIFEGEFVDDLKNGKGIEFNNGKIIFEGEYKDDLKNGKGIEYKNGYKVYEGNFENNYFNGNGTLFYNDGKIQYQGIIKNGFFWEDGFYYDINGEKTKFINGFPSKNKKYIENFKIYYSSGKIHYCLSKNKEIIKGKEYYETGKVKYNGTFKIINMMDLDKNSLGKLRNKDEYNCIIIDGNGTSFNNDGKKYIMEVLN